MIKAISICGLLVSTISFAQIPHTFTAGTPAKASEVNDNFNYLSSEIDDNTNTINELKNNIEKISNEISSNNCTSHANLLDISYESKEADNPVIDGEAESMKLFTYFNPLNGSTYKIKYPNIAATDPIVISDPIYLSMCPNLEIDGYPAVLNLTATYYQDARHKTDNYGYSLSPFFIKIDNIVIILGTDHSLYTQRNITGNYFYGERSTAPIVGSTTDNMTSLYWLERYKKTVDDWIDYIKIEKVQ